MANDDFTKLIFEVEQQGAAKVEKSFRNIEAGISAALQGYKKFSVEGEKSNKELQGNVEELRNSLGNLEKGIVQASSKYSGMFTGGKLRRQEKRVREITKKMDKLSKVMTSGSKEQKKMARERLSDLKKAADFEASQTAKVFQEHKKEFDRLVSTEKKSLADLSKDAMGGGLRGLQQLRQGDVRGFGKTAGGGLRNLGQQAQKKSFDKEMAAGGGKGGAAMSGGLGKLLKTFAKVAGPLAIAAGLIGTLVKMFLDLDAKVKDINKSMLKNVSLVEMASGNYDDFGSKMMDAESAMDQFRNTVMTDMDLRMLGLDEGEMANVLGTMNEQGMLLSDLRKQGVMYSDALETAQVAALNLGVDATQTADLIGKLADVTSESFDEAAASLTQVISFAHDAGVNTKKFFSVVQNITGEMGLYNYRIEETAALFSKLTNVMDVKSAEKFTDSMTNALKDASALERSTTVVVNGIGKVAKMADRTQKQMAKALDTDKMMEAFGKIGAGEMYKELGLEGAMKKLTTNQKNQLQSAVNDVDQATGEQLRKYRGVLEANRNSVMEMQGITMDFAIGDQIALQIGELEGKLRMPLENMNSVLAESQGVSEAQLRMMKAMKSDLSGDLSRLRETAAEDPESFQELAKSMGYNVKLSEIQNGEVKNWTDLLGVMTKDKQDKLIDEQKDQKTLAEKQAEMQRTLLDTVKYKLLDLVQGIYISILDIYDLIMDMNVFGDDGPGDKRRQQQEMIRQEFKAQQEIRGYQKQMKLAEGIKDPEKREKVIKNLQGKIDAKQKDISNMHKTRSLMDQGASKKIAGEMVEKGKSDVGGYTTQRESRKEAARRAVQDRFKGADFNYEGHEGMKGFQFQEEGFDLKSIKTKDGKVLEGAELRKELQKAVDEGINKRAEGAIDSDTLFGKDMEDSLKRGALSQDKIKNYTEQTKKALVDEGAKLDGRSLQELAEKIVKEEEKAARKKAFREELAKILGVDTKDFGNMQGVTKEANRMMAQGPEAVDASVKSGAISEAQGKKLKALLKPVDTKKAKDVKMLSGGIPFLDLQAGDIIVDQESLASTLAGGKGDYVPDLIRKNAGGGKGGGGGGGNVMHANFNIYGGDVSKIRESILKVIEEWERKRSTS